MKAREAARVMLRWLDPRRRRPGRRGLFLTFLTVLDVVYGYALVTTQVRTLNSIPYPDFFLPLHAWGWIWIGTGVFTATGILADRDVLQYTAVALLKAVWGMLYADLWIVQHIPETWVQVVIWVSFALTILLVAGWPEPQAARELLKAANGLSNGVPHLRDVNAPQGNP